MDLWGSKIDDEPADLIEPVSTAQGGQIDAKVPQTPDDDCAMMDEHMIYLVPQLSASLKEAKW